VLEAALEDSEKVVSGLVGMLLAEGRPSVKEISELISTAEEEFSEEVVAGLVGVLLTDEGAPDEDISEDTGLVGTEEDTEPVGIVEIEIDSVAEEIIDGTSEVDSVGTAEEGTSEDTAEDTESVGIEEGVDSLGVGTLSVLEGPGVSLGRELSEIVSVTKEMIEGTSEVEGGELEEGVIGDSSIELGVSKLLNDKDSLADGVTDEDDTSLGMMSVKEVEGKLEDSGRISDTGVPDETGTLADSVEEAWL
jgi:hypothetical protein